MKAMLGSDLRDIGEVLVGTHADIRAPGEARIAQGRHDVQIRPLVGDEVVGVEIPAGLGQLRDKRREGGRRLDVPDAGGAGQQEPGHDDAEEDAVRAARCEEGDGHQRTL